MNTQIIDHNAALPETYRQTADQVEVTLNGQTLRVLRYSSFDEPLYFVHASLPEDDTERKLKIIVKRKHFDCFIHPKRFGLNVEAADEKGKGKLVRFTGHPYLVFECDGLGYVFFCFDPLQEAPTGSKVLNASRAGIQSSNSDVQTQNIQAAIDQVAASETLETLVLPAGYYRSGDLHLKSGVELYLSSGAVLQASDSCADFGDPDMPGYEMNKACFINGQDVEHFSVTGHGHIDGNRPVLDMDRYFKGMVRLINCKHFSFNGPVLSDACGWNLTPRHCEDVHIHRTKILNNRPIYACINTDGCNPDGCRQVTIDHCFFHTGDDAVAVKSSDYGNGAQDTADITVRDLLAINNSATAKVGTETMAASMKNISFERIDAVRTCRLAAIDAYDYAKIENISFTDCHVSNLAGAWVTPYMIDLQAPYEAFRKIPAKSVVRGVSLKNISSDLIAESRVLTRIDEDGPAIQGFSAEGISANGKAVELVIEEV